MKKHTKIYFDYFDIWYDLATGDHEKIYCEITGKIAKDLHHIDNKGMGGSKSKDYIENIIALSREAHQQAHKGELSVEMLVLAHRMKVQASGKSYDKQKFLNLLK